MAFVEQSNYHNVRTASRLANTNLWEQGYRLLREHSWEISGLTADGDSGTEVTKSQVMLTEPGLIVGWSIISQVRAEADPGANDMQVTVNAIAMMGFTGGNMELAELTATIHRYAVGVVTGMHYDCTRRLYLKDYNMRWPLDDGDIMKPQITYYNSNGGAVSFSVFGEFRIYVAEKG